MKKKGAKKPKPTTRSERMQRRRNEGTDDERQMWAGRATRKACGAKSLLDRRGLGGI